MKLHLFLFSSCLLLAFKVILTPTILIPYRYGDKWGFADTNQKIVIPCKYITADLFRYNRARVMTNTLYGYINMTGQLVIPDAYIDARRFASGFGKVSTNVQSAADKQKIIIDTSGNVIKAIGGCQTPNDFPEAKGEKFTENGKTGFAFFPEKMNLRSIEITKIPAVYDELVDNYMGYLYARKGEKWGMLDVNNRVVLPFEYDAITPGGQTHFKEGCIIIKNGLKGFADYRGRIIIPTKYQTFDFWENACEDASGIDFKVAKVKNEKGQFGFVDMKGREYWKD